MTTTNTTISAQWYSGKGAARFLGFANYRSIKHLPIKCMVTQDGRGKTRMKYHINDLTAYRDSVTQISVNNISEEQ